MIGSAVITTMGSARLHFIAYLLLSCFYSAFLQPIIIHWVWHDAGWMHKQVYFGHEVSVKDHAGGMAVHLASGTISLIGFLFLGRRLLRLRDIDESSLGSESPGSTITGYIFIAIGLIAFALPTPRFEETHPAHNYVGIILVNCIMAMAVGIIIVVALHFICYRDTFNYWIILRCIQGSLAGIVSVASGVDVYSPIVAFALAAGGALLFYFLAQAIHLSSLEDYCNVIAINFVCGLLSALAPLSIGSQEKLAAFFASRACVDTPNAPNVPNSWSNMFVRFQWQIVCCLAIAGLCLVTSLIFFLLLPLCGLLRNREERISHRRGVNVFDNKSSGCCLGRLFAIQKNVTTLIRPGLSGKNPEQRRVDWNPNHATGTNDTHGQSYSGTNRVREEGALNPEPNAESELGETTSETKGRKPRFMYTVANVHDIVRFQHQDDTVQAGGDCEKVKQNFAMIEPAKSLSNDLIFLGEISKKQNTGNRKGTAFHRLHKTRKYTNLHKRKTFMMLNTRNQNSSSAGDAGIFLQSVDCMLYDAKYNDGFVTLKMPTELDDNSDTCPNEYEQISHKSKT